MSGLDKHEEHLKAHQQFGDCLAEKDPKFRRKRKKAKAALDIMINEHKKYAAIDRGKDWLECK